MISAEDIKLLLQEMQEIPLKRNLDFNNVTAPMETNISSLASCISKPVMKTKTRSTDARTHMQALGNTSSEITNRPISLTIITPDVQDAK